MGSVPSGVVGVSRGVAMWVMRSVSAGAVLYGAYLVIKKVLFGIGSGQVDMIFGVWEGTGEGHSLYRGLSMIVVGVALGLASRRLAAWVFAVPSRVPGVRV